MDFAKLRSEHSLRFWYIMNIYGHRFRSDSQSISKFADYFGGLQHEVVKWLREHVGDQNWDFYRHSNGESEITFYSREDLLLFKLRWL